VHQLKQKTNFIDNVPNVCQGRWRSFSCTSLFGLLASAIMLLQKPPRRICNQQPRVCSPVILTFAYRITKTFTCRHACMCAALSQNTISIIRQKHWWCYGRKLNIKRYSRLIQCHICKYAAFSSAVVTDRAGIYQRPQQPKPVVTAIQSHVAQVCH